MTIGAVWACPRPSPIAAAVWEFLPHDGQNSLLARGWALTREHLGCVVQPISGAVKQPRWYGGGHA
jgi:hypothetical protein